ncbi:hypothetical protein [Blastococcus sp. TF02A-35]|uniref:hypothetical protein n=1 Tax=Blastococcus sp. TF02A-35 TaxID=2559612 RepID=UPI001073172C|nr:hypothetical protein [Blastococcus sp. TF02A_35]TFV52882.1 hypothetical protein E4P43_04595 [Blastococcus sp. TF02A_35]
MHQVTRAEGFGAFVSIAVGLFGAVLAVSGTTSGRGLALAGAIGTGSIVLSHYRPLRAEGLVRWVLQPSFTVTLTIFGYFAAEALSPNAPEQTMTRFGILVAALITLGVSRATVAGTVQAQERARLQAIQSEIIAVGRQLDEHSQAIRKLRRRQHAILTSGHAGVLRKVWANLTGG